MALLATDRYWQLQFQFYVHGETCHHFWVTLPHGLTSQSNHKNILSVNSHISNGFRKESTSYVSIHVAEVWWFSRCSSHLIHPFMPGFHLNNVMSSLNYNGVRLNKDKKTLIAEPLCWCSLFSWLLSKFIEAVVQLVCAVLH